MLAAVDFAPLTVIAMVPEEMGKTIGMPAFRLPRAETGAEPVGNTPGQVPRQMKDDTETFAQRVEEARVLIE